MIYLSILVILCLPVCESWVLFPTPPVESKVDCKCFMNGIYYEDGMQWKDDENPCIEYKCKRGSYTPVRQGCEFQNECKGLGDIWTERCFTYNCTTQGRDRSLGLKIIEGGCLLPNGECLKFGIIAEDDKCNKIECTIEGDCYKLKTIEYGCKFAGRCKPLNSVWTDRCSLYQCVKEMDYVRVSNDIMNWPEENYSLLMPRYGCPSGVDDEWQIGHRRHYGKGAAYVSQEFNAFGNYTETFFDQYFCSHVHLEGVDRIPRYQTYWDPGNYCILRRNGTCPKSFTEGSITMDDADRYEASQNVSGLLPDGNFTKDTTLEFCCRSDGNVKEPILLPTDKPFYLFLHDEQHLCQDVRGMDHTVEYFVFDNEYKNGTIYESGSIPLALYDQDKKITTYLCFYTPLLCGCKDEQGWIIKEDEIIQSDCVWYICLKTGELYLLAITKGGCIYDGSCRNETETWIESKGEACEIKECQRLTTDDGPKFEVVTTKSGCRDEENCRSFGYNKTIGCSVTQCTKLTGVRQEEVLFKEIQAGCSDGSGGCVSVGENFERNCSIHKCVESSGEYKVDYLSGKGCFYDGSCRNETETWIESKGEACDIKECQRLTTDDGPKFEVVTTKSGCEDSDGKCRNENETWEVKSQSQCKIKTCKKEGNATQIITNDLCTDGNGGCQEC